MKIRADIAELIRAGHTDVSIARRLHCGTTTVGNTRRAIGYPPATTLGRLYAEAVPTGRVKDYRPERMPTSPDQAAANRARLLAALRNAA